MTSRKTVLLAAAGLGLVLVAAALGPPADGPLELGDGGSGVGAGLDVGESLTYGSVTVRNGGSEPLVLDAVELRTDQAAAATVVEVRVLDADAAPRGSLVAAAYDHPPPRAATEVAGAVLHPSRHYQLLFTVRLDAEGPTLFHEVRVRYRAGLRRYAETATHQLQLCHPHGVQCPAPPPR